MVVSRVVDGDTVEIASGAHVRIIGIDTPERGDCGYDEATAALRRMVEGREVELVDPASVQDRDTYDRLLRFVDVAGRDTGLAQVRAGWATARYDSRDGYDAHPREDRYRAADPQHDSPCGRLRDAPGRRPGRRAGRCTVVGGGRQNVPVATHPRTPGSSDGT